MTRHWSLLLAGLIGLSLIALFPLRMVMSFAGFDQMGLSARQVAGSVWYGRIGQLNLRDAPLGSYDVSLQPLPLLLGRIGFQIVRLEGDGGVLSGTLSGGSRRGISDASGRLSTAQLFQSMPVEALDLDDVTILFDDGRCAEASGTVRAQLAPELVSLTGVASLSGVLACKDGKVAVSMAVAGNQVSLQLALGGDGKYQGEVRLGELAVGDAATQALSRFGSNGAGQALRFDGQL